jgi:hypothetical protein
MSHAHLQLQHRGPTEQAEAADKSSVLPHNYPTDRGICTSETQAAQFQQRRNKLSIHSVQNSKKICFILLDFINHRITIKS